MNTDKWIMIFLMVVVVSITSCAGYAHHNNTEYRIAQLECHQNEVDE